MTTKQFFWVFLLGIGLIACGAPENQNANAVGSEEQTHNDHDGHDHDDHDHDGHDHSTHDGEEMVEGDGKHFGETINEANAIPLPELFGQLESSDSVSAKVVGTVKDVCQAKGCWMNVVYGEGESKNEIFVKFKDYGFLMPKDIAGRQVVMDGYAFREVTPVETLKHFAEDAGKSQEEIASITTPKEETKFIASGVVLLDPESK